MTCEIAIMNRQVIVLAADSATTVTGWVDGQREERYFKGANKIFQLSNHHPVGLMIFDGANLHGVPWEVLVKDFRNNLGDKSFNSIDGYANEFFAFVASHAYLFPPTFQEKIFLEEAINVAWMYLLRFAPSDSRISSSNTRGERTNAYGEYFAEWREYLDTEPLPPPFSEEEYSGCRAKYLDQIHASIVTWLAKGTLDADIDPTVLADISLSTLIKRFALTLDKTGIVVAGYGDHDFFPGFAQYDCYGILLGKLLSEKKSERKIDHDISSFIQPFATTSMVQTFWMGISPDLDSTVHSQHEACTKDALQGLIAETGAVAAPDLLDRLVRESTEQFRDSIVKQVQTKHIWPMSRVVSALPTEDMAELAETLIMLESLKEKVTKPTSSVSGPIDVAVISKSDGFVWVRRKHYFDASLNSRFLARQAARMKT